MRHFLATTPRVLLALAIGTLGGWIAWMIGVPLAWMIGAMLAATAASLAGAPVMVWMPLRSVFVAVLGVMLGSGFTPEILDQMADWALALAVLLLCAVVSAAICTWFFRRVAGYDRITSYFAAMPGGLAEMTIIGEAMGGKARTISLTHGIRVLLVVIMLPFAFQLLLGYEPGSQAVPGPDLMVISASDLAILAACGIAGYAAAKRLRIPAAVIVGPMLVSAGVHLAGITEVGPPNEIVAAAQVVVGTVIGCRFAGMRLAEIGGTALWAAAGTLILLAVAVAFASGATALTGIGLAPLILAYAPGGLAEMSLIALALGVEASFVATHHIIRIVLIVVLAPTVFQWIVGRRTR